MALQNKIRKVYEKYCNEKNYQIKDELKSTHIRLDIASMKEETIVNIFSTGTISIQGKDNKLRQEMEFLKQKIANDDGILIDMFRKVKACSSTYKIIKEDLRLDIKKEIYKFKNKIEVSEKPKNHTDYVAKISAKSSSLTVIQYSNGTLLIQGKTDFLFDNICDLVEKVANPSEEEVIARFISDDEDKLKAFQAKFTPELLDFAEKKVKKNIGEEIYNFLELYDQKWLIASECILISDIMLPEYSPIVMPSSKAYEGFLKKLLTKIGLVDKDYFSKPGSNFSPLSDPKNQKRQKLCDKEKYVDAIFKEINVSLNKNRHFFMHSDNSVITKIDTLKEAESQLKEIHSNITRFYKYFKDTNLFI